MTKKKKTARRRGPGVGLLLAAVAALAAALYLLGGAGALRGSGDLSGEIARNRAALLAMEQQAPADLNAEVTRQRRERLAARNGILVDDLQAEQQRVMAINDYNQADFLRWFENAAIVGDSIIRQIRLFHILDAPVFAKGGIHLSVNLDLLDEVEAAGPSVIFMCFGMNDVGVFEENVDRFVDRYCACIRRLQISLPDSVVYVEAILPVTDKALAQHSDYQYIDLYNERMRQACQEIGAYFIDASFLLTGPEMYAPDGVHPAQEYYPRWLTYLADISGLSNDA